MVNSVKEPWHCHNEFQNLILNKLFTSHLKTQARGRFLVDRNRQSGGFFHLTLDNKSN